MTGQEWLQYWQQQGAGQDKPKAGWLDPVASALGAGIGFVGTGFNPAGALAGYQIGHGVGDTAEGVVNHNLSADRLVGNASGAYGGVQGMQNLDNVSPQGGGTQAAMPDPFAPDQGPVTWPNAQVLSLMPWLMQGGLRGYAGGGAVGSPLFMQAATGEGVTPEQMVGAAPPRPQFEDAKHPTLEMLAQLLPLIAAQLPAPRPTKSVNKTIGAWAPAIATAASGPLNIQRQAREKRNATLQEQYDAEMKAYNERLTEAGKALWKRREDKAANTIPPEMRKALKLPEWVTTHEQAKSLIEQQTQQRAALNTLFDNIKTLPDVSKFPDIRDAYERVKSSSAGGTGVSDMSLIFAYMRILDPTSVVREGEYARAQDTAGLPASIVNTYNRLVSGASLTPDQRKDFRRMTETMYERKRTYYRRAMETLRKQAEFYGVDPNLVLPNYEADQSWNPAPSGATTGVEGDGRDASGYLAPPPGAEVVSPKGGKK